MRLWSLLFLHYDIKDVSPAKDAEKISIPVLIIHSTRDQVTSYENGLLLQKSLKNNPHAEFFVTNTLHGQRFKNYKQLIAKFYAENLGK